LLNLAQNLQILFVANVKHAVPTSNLLPDAVETMTQDVRLAPSVQEALKLPELARLLQTQFARNARTVVPQHLV